MTIVETKIKALKQTLKQLEQEYKCGFDIHDWNEQTCLLCIKFTKCKHCPLFDLVDDTGCVRFFNDYQNTGAITENHKDTPVIAIASVIYQMILYYEEVNNDNT